MSHLTVRVIPNASKSEVVGQEGSTWKIRLAAPPVDGKANETLVRFLADLFDLAPSEIDLIKGHASKTKILSIPMNGEDVTEGLRTASGS